MSYKKIVSVLAAALCAAGMMWAGGGGEASGGGKAGGTAAGKQKLIIYTSMKESMIADLVNDFKAKNPDIDVDYQSAGAGKLMAKIATERESGAIMADIIWTSEVPDFYSMKQDGILIKYRPQGADAVLNPLEGVEDYFIPARLGTLGIAYNTTQIKTAPAKWQDLFTASYKGAFAIADPALSGTSYVSIAMLQQVFGDQFFQDLYKNGALIGKGSGQVVDDTASGELAASLAVDYITFDKVDKGATIGMAYPPEMLVVPSPVAILKDTKVLSAAQKFVDYLISKDAQQIIANNGTLPVRSDVAPPAKYHIPSASDAMTRGVKVDYIKMMAEKEQRINAFKAIMQP